MPPHDALVLLPLVLLVAWLAATLASLTGSGGGLLLLPALAAVWPGTTAVLLFTAAQVVSNASRATFGWRDIHWRAVARFLATALPAALVGASLWQHLPPDLAGRWVGGVTLGMLAWRRWRPAPPDGAAAFGLAAAGAGFISGVAGSAGPLQIAVFLRFGFPARELVATEAAATTLLHLGKLAVFLQLGLGAGLGWPATLAVIGCTVGGAWTGQRLLHRLTPERGSQLIEAVTALVAGWLLLR